jgi:hypothetical protein
MSAGALEVHLLRLQGCRRGHLRGEWPDTDVLNNYAVLAKTVFISWKNSL